MSLVPAASTAVVGSSKALYDAWRVFAPTLKHATTNPTPLQLQAFNLGVDVMKKAGRKAAKAVMGRPAKKAKKSSPKKSVGETRTLPSKKAPGRKIATDPALPGIYLSNGSVIRIRFPWPTYDNGTLNSDNLVSRTRNNILVKGIKVCHRFTATLSVANELYQGPLKVRWYLLQKKDGYYNIDPNVASQELNTRF